MKRIAFIYCDTNGLHKSRESIVTALNINAWARLVVLYYIIGHKEGDTIVIDKKKKIIIKPDKFEIPQVTTNIHGITTEYALEHGKNINTTLQKLNDELQNIDIIVTHNMEFHLKTIQAECFRSRETLIQFNKYTLIDLMSFYHDMENPSMKKLVETILKVPFELKTRFTNVIWLKKLFNNMYLKFEESCKKQP
jgi:hypothetical protein